MIAIVDYGMGNIASISTALKRMGHEVILTDSEAALEKATHIILPGVGSFQAAVEEINQRGLRDTLIRLAGEKPFLGICLGMQLLFSNGSEGGNTKGLDIIPGEVKKIETDYLLPHIGWNALEIKNGERKLKAFQDRHVYFVHSYEACTSSGYIVATAGYGKDIPAIVQKDNVLGIQFHPEKSGEVGVKILESFLQEEIL